MPAGLEAYCQQILEDIETSSLSIRRSALAYANGQNFEVSERLRRALETIRISADAILEAIAKASVTDYTLDDRLKDWLFSGGLQSCLGKLKEMEAMFKPVNPVRPAAGAARPSRPNEDKLTAAMIFFDRHKDLFHFLVTPDAWNRERLNHQPSESVALPVPERTEHNSQDNHAIVTESSIDNTSKVRHQSESHRRQLEEILRWLAALNCTDKHNYIRQLRQEGTCKWFPNTDAYGLWRTRGAFFPTSKYTPTVRKPRPQDAQFLWLHGKAGCGKSVLVASTIEHLKTTLQSREEVMAFFYFDFQNERSRSPVEMMRSLLSQLCRHLLDLGVDAGNFPATMLEEKGRGTLSLSDLDKLSGLVSCAADRFVWEPIVVIDALDECADIESLLHALVRLHNDDKVRLLVTSRPHQEMMRHFKKFPSLSFEDMTMALAADIELHVRQEINRGQMKAPSPEMKREVHENLIKKAEGRFRWVQCQIDILKRCATAQELKKVLDNLPTELEATYERILDAIDERSLLGKLARRVLAWLMVALEPIRLVQIVDMLLVDFPSQQNIIREGAELIDVLSSLVSHYKTTDVVSLSHFSVEEFLIGRTTLPMYQIILSDAHSEVVLSCMRYISAFIKQIPFRRNVTTLESWPMLSYVFSSGFNHLAHLDPESIVVLDTLQLLGSDARHHPSYWDRLCQLRENLQSLYPPWPSSRHDLVLYVLIAYAPIQLFQTFLSGHWPIKARIGTNPLVYAADLRKTSHATALLAYGVDVNEQSLAIDDSHHVSPLDVSIDRDEDLLVGELLQRGCLVTPELLATVVCMPWCSARVLVKLTQTDEFVEWSHMIGDEELYRGIFSSARPNAGDVRKADEDHVALARRLHQIGQDLSADSPFGAKLIEHAFHAAHTSMLGYLLPADRPPRTKFLLMASIGDTSESVSIVRFLLGRGADVNVVSKHGDTVLHLASRCPWEPRSLELTKMLIDGGCNPDVVNSRGETPLTIAAGYGYLSVVERLLLCNVSFPSNTLLSALQRRSAPKTSVVELLLMHNAPLPRHVVPFALQQHSPLQLVQLLIRNGASVHSTSSRGKTIFHLAVIHYDESMCLELVKCFIEAGGDLTRGETALRNAIKRRYTSVVELLLSHNVRCSLPFALQQRSPLQLVQLLIRNGADVHSTSSEGKTIFHLAINNYEESECLELVKSFFLAGGNHTICNSKWKTGLYTAFEHRYISVVRFLLSPGSPPLALQQRLFPQQGRAPIRHEANVHSTSSTGEPAFHLAITNHDNYTRMKTVESLIKGDTNPTSCNSEEASELDIAIKCGYDLIFDFLLESAKACSAISDREFLLLRCIARCRERLCLISVKNYMKAGYNANIRSFMGETALRVAIKRRYTSVVKLLLSHNVRLPSRILPFALQQRSPLRLVQLLIREGADVHSTSSEGETIFDLVIANYEESTCLELVKRFVDAGGNLSVQNSKGEMALHTAIKRGYTYVVELLLSHNVRLPSHILPFALQQCPPPQLVQLLIREGADVHSTSSEGETIFDLVIAHYYEESTCLELVKCFIDAGGNPTVQSSKGEMALYTAVEREYTSLVELILSHNVSLPSGILLFALQRRSPPSLVQLLIREGVRSTSSKGETIFHLVIVNYEESTCLELVKRFVDAGGNPSVRNSKGETPLHTAIKRRYTYVVELLLSHNVRLPSHIILFALQRRSPPQLVQLLIREGADVPSISSEGETIFDLVIANYEESTCLELVKSFIDAGGNLRFQNSKGKTPLHTAIKRRYTSVVELLLSHNVRLPGRNLPFTLRQRFTSRLVRYRIREGAGVYSTSDVGGNLSVRSYARRATRLDVAIERLDTLLYSHPPLAVPLYVPPPPLHPTPVTTWPLRPASGPKLRRAKHPRRPPAVHPPTRYPHRRFGHQTGQGR